MRKVFHALVLNFHQPLGNLEALLDSKSWEADEILWAMDRMPRALWPYEDLARVHASFSGTLLETLSNPGFQERTYGIARCGDLLWHLQNRRIFEILGTGYYHPVFPLIPEADWAEQLGRWRGIAQHVFWRTSFRGFWPPELGFSMEMIPHLKRHGFDYAIVDSNYVEPLGSMGWAELRYRPHVARHQGQEIVVVVRDRELSDAQESGMDAGWFMQEVHERTKYCNVPPLVLTATDGDNGGWFRNTSDQANFWHVFYRALLDWVRRGETEVEPIYIHDYLDRYGVGGEVRVRTGAWNTGWHPGDGFLQWTGSQRQRDALARIHQVSQKLQAVADRAANQGNTAQDRWRHVNEARWRLLRAETSCNLYWGEAWVERLHRDLDEADAELARATDGG